MNLKFLNFFSRKNRHQKMLDLLKFYWTDKKNPSKNELSADLFNLGFDNKEAGEIANKFFSEVLFNKELNEGIYESIRGEMNKSTKEIIKNQTGKEISDDFSNELFDTLKNQKIGENDEK